MSSTTQEENINVKVNIKLPNTHVAHVNNKKAPNQQKLSFQFNKDTKIQTVLEVLAVANQSKYLTNIQLRHNDVILNDEQQLSELTSEKSISKDVPIDVSVETKPYTTREALRHALIVRDFIGFVSEMEDNLSNFAISTGTKFQSLPLTEIKEKKPEEEKKDETKEDEDKKQLLDVTDDEKDKTNKMVHEIFKSFKESSIKTFFNTETNLITPCVRSLNLSQYNPVPTFYKSKGHLLYLQVVTLEGESLHITATASGFFVNKSTNNKFDPSIKSKTDEETATGHHHKHNQTTQDVFYNLYDLLAAHSKNFISHIEKLDAKLSTLEPAAYVKPQTAYLHKPWLISNVPANNGDYSNLQVEHINNIINPERNFNDEFQAIKDLPTSSLPGRIESERLLAKLIFEFSTSATKGAMLILQKDIVAMNPDSDETEQIFLKDNIFYSYVTDVSGIYETRGGDEAARAASNQDLLAISVLNRINLKDIRYLLTTIVDFGGKRILAQTPVPGLLGTMGAEFVKDETTGEETLNDLPNDIVVNYGFDENTKSIVKDEKFDNILGSDFSKIFHLKKNGEEDVWFASQSKGIIGFDKRNYILDLANTYPIDINFAKEHFDNAKEEDRYPHRQTLLRPELVEKWWNEKVEAENDLTIEKAYDERKFSYNPDAYQVEGVEDKVIDEVSTYLNDQVIPSVVEDYAEGNVAPPYTGSHLVDTLHKNGINLRYLGKVIKVTQDKLNEQETKHDARLKEIEKANEEYEAWEQSYLMKIEAMIKERQEKINKYVEEGKEVPKELTENLKLDDEEVKKPTNEEAVIVGKDELIPVIKIAEIEIIARSMKHILRSYGAELPIVALSSMVAYFFNLLFGTVYNDKPEAESVDDFYAISSYKFSSVERDELLNEIIEQAKLRFRYNLSSETLEETLKNQFTLIKEISTKFGVQLVNKNYYFTLEQFEEFKQSQDKKVRNKIAQPLMTFSKDDLIIIPLVKSSKYSSLTSEEYWNQGSILISEEKKQEGLTLMAQSIAILEDVKGVVNQEVAEKYLSMATIYSRLGLIPEAIAFCRKSNVIYERTNGIDSFELLRAMNNLALLELSNDSPYNAAIIYNRIIQTMTIFRLDDLHHPIATSIFNHLEQIALGVNDLNLAIDVLTNLSQFIVNLDGNKAIAYGFTESRLGNLSASLKDYRAALEHIVNAKNIFFKELGSNNHLTASAKQWINGLSNLMKDIQQKKQMQQDQATVSGVSTSGSGKKSHSKKDVSQNPELAKKSVDELLDFIEGEDSKKKSSKGSKSQKKNGKK